MVKVHGTLILDKPCINRPSGDFAIYFDHGVVALQDSIKETPIDV